VSGLRTEYTVNACHSDRRVECWSWSEPECGEVSCRSDSEVKGQLELVTSVLSQVKVGGVSGVASMEQRTIGSSHFGQVEISVKGDDSAIESWNRNRKPAI